MADRALITSEPALRRRLRAVALVRRTLMYAVVVALGLLYALPLLWMISTSLKDDAQTYHVPPIWIPNPMRFANYSEALTKQPFGLFFLNTFWYAIPATFGAVISSALVAYGFSRFRWWGRDVLFFVCLMTIMIPFQVRMVPLYLIFKNLNWLNSYKPLIIPAFLGDVYFIFLLRQFFMTIPRELDDACKIDGGGPITLLTRVIVPLSLPVFGVVTILQFVSRWNDFFWPLIFLNTMDNYTISLGLRLFQTRYFVQTNIMMAMSLLAALPTITLFFLAQRYFIRGIVLTGVNK